MPAPAPPPQRRASDQDRVASAPKFAERPENPLPFARGNTTERVEAAPEERRDGAWTRARAGAAGTPPAEDRTRAARRARRDAGTARRRRDASRQGGAARRGPARTCRSTSRSESFNNPQGGVNEFGPAIQFDTKGVEFGPWIRRFVAQVKRNWFVPNAAICDARPRHHQFNVHKDGSITDINVVRPSEVDSFNRSAFNAILGVESDPAAAAGYPADKAFFTVTFFLQRVADRRSDADPGPTAGPAGRRRRCSSCWS